MNIHVTYIEAMNRLCKLLDKHDYIVKEVDKLIDTNDKKTMKRKKEKLINVKMEMKSITGGDSLDVIRENVAYHRKYHDVP